jgi:hypothetical protein
MKDLHTRYYESKLALEAKGIDVTELTEGATCLENKVALTEAKLAQLGAHGTEEQQEAALIKTVMAAYGFSEAQAKSWVGISTTEVDDFLKIVTEE